MTVTSTDRRIWDWYALAGLLLLAALQYIWNTFTVTPLVGYDAVQHAAYVLTIVEDGRLPHPLEGWSTFHPPLYYLLGAGLWKLLEPLGAQWVVAGLRALSALGMLAAGGVAFWLVRRSGCGAGVASVASALVLFVPVAQMSAVMVGNEALATGWAALALVGVVRLQEDAGRLGAAAWAGLFAGLALATKYTGLFVVVACVVPFVGVRWEGRVVRALVLCGLVALAVAGPVYVRNAVLTGTPVPMTRGLEPMRSAEAAFEIGRPRRVSDYMWISPRVLARPSIHHRGPEPFMRRSRNPAIETVWGLAYASAWYDAFAQRIHRKFHRDGVWSGPLLATLGLTPTALMLLGVIGSLRGTLRNGSRTAEAPLLAMSLMGILTFVIFTWRAPSLAVVKTSYLLPLVVPAGLFFARGVGMLGGGRLRTAVLALSAAAALASAVVFANGVVFPTAPGRERQLYWSSQDKERKIPGTHLGDVAERLLRRH